MSLRDLSLLLIHLVATLAHLVRPGGVRSVVAESLLLKHQLLILNRPRKRALDLRVLDRFIAGLCAAMLHPSRLARSAIALKPATLLRFHRYLVKCKYRKLFSSKRRGEPGPKGPSRELIRAIIEMKRRNPRFGYQRIADQISLIFGVDVDRHVVRRVLALHYRPEPESGGPSWLTLLGHIEDSLWSIDLFRCESLILKSYWVMVVLDQYTRRIVGFATHVGAPDGPAVCRLFGRIICGLTSPVYLSSDHDPLFEFQRWKANLRILDIAEVKTFPYAPISHPFVERLIGTVRREYLDQTPFQGTTDLDRKLALFKNYYNQRRTHQGINGRIPDQSSDNPKKRIANINNFAWKSHCHGLFQLPIAA